MQGRAVSISLPRLLREESCFIGLLLFAILDVQDLRLFDSHWILLCFIFFVLLCFMILLFYYGDFIVLEVTL